VDVVDKKNRDKISNFSNKKQLLFGICCIERILYLYKNFEDEIKDEDDTDIKKYKIGYKELEGLIEESYKIILEEKIYDIDEYKNFEKMSQILAPDTEEISSENAVIAQNCAIGVSYLFDFLLEPNFQKIIYVTEKIIETIDILGSINEKEDEEIENKILDELKKQNEYIKIIEKLENITQKDIINLQETNKKNRIV
jgi:hypothetical protein